MPAAPGCLCRDGCFDGCLDGHLDDGLDEGAPAVLTPATVQQLRGRRVVVVGDALLDRFTETHRERPCREAPAPRVRLDAVRSCPGGAANTAANVASMGAAVELVSVVGDDPAGHELGAVLGELAVGQAGIVHAHGWSTPLLDRLRADGRLLARVDRGSEGAPGEAVVARLALALQELAATADAVIVSDYARGAVGAAVVDTVARLAAWPGGPLVAVDAHHLARYRQVRPAVVKPNWEEVVALLGDQVGHRDGDGGDRFDARGGDPGRDRRVDLDLDLDLGGDGGVDLERDRDRRRGGSEGGGVPAPDPDAVPGRVEAVTREAPRILRLTGARIVAVTLDRDGAVVLERGRPPHRTFTRPTSDDRATGAGDTFLAALTLGLASGLPTPSAADLAATAASVVTRHRYTARCTADALQQALGEEARAGEVRAGETAGSEATGGATGQTSGEASANGRVPRRAAAAGPRRR